MTFDRNKWRKEWRKSPKGIAYDKKWRAKNPDKVRSYARKWQVRKAYGLSMEEYTALRAKPCALCGGKGDTVIDHCHKTYKVRGVLCRCCNSMIGLAKDSPKLLRKAATYIERSRK